MRPPRHAALGAALAAHFAAVSSSAQTAEACRDSLRGAKASTYSDGPAGAEYDKADCADRDTYCVGPDGFPLPMEETDPALVAGSKLKVKLFGPASCAELLGVAVDRQQSRVRLFRSPDPGGDGQKKASSEGAIQLLATTVVATDAQTDSVTVRVYRTDVTHGIDGITLEVRHERYFLDVGLLVAFAYGYQQVSPARLPGLRDEFIRETDTIRPAAAITVNYFPFGQLSEPRFTGVHGLGVQAGIGGDLDPIDDEFYMGLIYEPVPGAGVSAGVALLQMQKLQPDYPSGVLIDPGDVPRDTFLGARPYVGVSLNTEVFETVMKAGAKARVPD